MPSTINYQAGELLLVDFPFTVGGASKLRPALVMLDTGDADVLLARVTTQLQTGPFDIPLTNWQQSGLLAPSVVRVHKLASIAKSRIQKRLGALTSVDRQKFGSVLRQLFSAW
jgi:mRNA interferase MazF